MSNTWNGSLIMEEFVKIAKDKGFLPTNLNPDNKDIVGNSKTPTPVKDHRRYEPTEEYDVTKEEGKDLIEKAHPKKMQTAKSQGEGGVVENVVEQQEKDIGVATKMPHGSLIGVHANLISELVKLANEYEDKGDRKNAERIDAVIRKIYNPFDNSRLHKKAFWNFVIQGLMLAGGILGPMVMDWFNKEKSGTEVSRKYDKKGRVTKEVKTPTSSKIGFKGRAAGLAVSGLGLLGLLGNTVTSLQEGIKEDTQDLYDILQKYSSESKSAAAAAQKLAPFATMMKNINLSDEKAFKNFVTEYNKFKTILPQIKSDISKATEIEAKSYFSWGIGSRVEEKLNDFEKSMAEMDEIIKKINNISAAVGQDIKDSIKEDADIHVEPGVKGLQTILSQHGFMGQKWDIQATGELDDNTIAAAKELEQKLDPIAKEISEKSAVGSIIDGSGNLDEDPRNLLEIIDYSEKYLQN
jgi:hypothetical protein